MIELTEQQLRALDNDPAFPRLVDPRTGEAFVLLRLDEYERLKDAKYDDSPGTKEELQALAWEAGIQAEQARAVESIRQGLEDRDAGRTISLEEFREHARRKHGISV